MRRDKCGDKCGDGRVCEILLYNAAVEHEQKSCFLVMETGAAAASAVKYGYKNSVIQSVPPTLDSILDGQGADYIKYDVEGGREALEGSSKTICDFMPDICLSLYHRSEDIFDLPLSSTEWNQYSLYLRKKKMSSAWEIIFMPINLKLLKALTNRKWV